MLQSPSCHILIGLELRSEELRLCKEQNTGLFPDTRTWPRCDLKERLSGPELAACVPPHLPGLLDNKALCSSARWSP